MRYWLIAVILMFNVACESSKINEERKRRIEQKEHEKKRDAKKSLTPTEIWKLLPEREIRIRVVDKTVPHPNYREHGSLFWSLNHEKTSPIGHDRPWLIDKDYLGFYPERIREDGRGTHLPLFPGDLKQIDMLYIADVYGVYVLDYEEKDKYKAALDYSHLIAGGFEVYETLIIEEFVKRGGMLVGEFNTFASPTHGKARKKLEELFGVRWTLWSGRFFDDLSQIEEVPVWARRNWEVQYRTPWEFEGPGFLIVHEDERLFVLEQDLDVTLSQIKIHHLMPDDELLKKVTDGIKYYYWFDILTPMKDTEVLSEYRLDLTDSGRKKMKEFGVPEKFPAIVRVSKDPLRLYFAGDFADNVVPKLPYDMVHAMIEETDGTFGVGFEGAFFWRLYIPLLRNVLDYAEKAIKKPEFNLKSTSEEDEADIVEQADF